MAYTILQVPGDGEVIGLGFLTRIRDNQEFLVNKPGVGNHFQRFTSSGTWTKPADVTWVYAQVIGGGAGGIHQVGANYPGGGGGHITEALLRAADLGNTVSVTVGAGGDGARRGFDTSGGISAFGSDQAAGGHTPGNNGLAIADNLLVEMLGRPGQGGCSYLNYPLGVPGIGQGSYTTALTDGADSDTGTGSGGGGAGSDSTDAGNGGIPGGGGGSAKTDNAAGDGGRGEVRVYAW